MKVVLRECTLLIALGLAWPHPVSGPNCVCVENSVKVWLMGGYFFLLEG